MILELRLMNLSGYPKNKLKQLKNYLVVIYKESDVDGFIITAFRVRNIKPYLRKEILWKKQ